MIFIYSAYKRIDIFHYLIYIAYTHILYIIYINSYLKYIKIKNIIELFSNIFLKFEFNHYLQRYLNFIKFCNKIIEILKSSLKKN